MTQYVNPPAGYLPYRNVISMVTPDMNIGIYPSRAASQIHSRSVVELDISQVVGYAPGEPIVM